MDSLANADAMGWAFSDASVFAGRSPRPQPLGRSRCNVPPSNDGLPDTDVHAFGGGAGVLFGAGPSIGVMASTDGGTTWRCGPIQAGRAPFGHIVVDSADGQHLLAADETRAGAAESTDGARTWKRVDTGLTAATWLSASATLDELVASGPAGR